jgi:cytochrome c556
MKLLRIFLTLFISTLLGCSPKNDPPISPLTLQQLMGWVIDSNADVIWDSVKTITDINGTKEIFPKTDAEWESIRNSAATLVEAGDLLIAKSKNKEDKQWVEFATRLSQTSMKALQATQDKNKDALFDAGGEIYNACKACHDKYADFDKKASK